MSKPSRSKMNHLVELMHEDVGLQEALYAALQHNCNRLGVDRSQVDADMLVTVFPSNEEDE